MGSFPDPGWWREGVIYQIYPRSFMDSNGDGVGDLPGVTARLDHLERLGVDALWLTPTYPSPNADWGYDVSDYLGVHEDLGTLADLDDLIAEAGARGIAVLLDLVPNHTSDRHPWFLDALTGRGARYRDFYVWADPGPDGGPPNNWLSTFGGSAWTFHEPSGQYYLHSFLPEQPDLNWWNDAVKNAFDDVLRYWFARGVAGFRIDVAHAIVKDSLLRDNPPPRESDHERVRAFGQLQLYNTDRPEVHEVFRRWRALCRAYEPERVLLGETFLFDAERIGAYYGRGDELHLAFNFIPALGPFEAESLAASIAAVEDVYPADAQPAWAFSNHDIGRFATRWVAGDEAGARCALVLLLTLRGTPILYYGDEIAQTEPEIAMDDLRDPIGVRGYPNDRGRDGCRTPLNWDASPARGFTSGARPWLPFSDATRNVAAQRDDPASVLGLTRALISLRRREGLGRAPFLLEEARGSLLLYRRGDDLTVALNLGNEESRLPVSGEVVIASDRSGEGEPAPPVLQPWRALVIKARRPDA